MTRKDFEALAAMVAEIPAQGIGPEALAYNLASFCAERNPRFDRAKFLAACSVVE